MYKALLGEIFDNRKILIHHPLKLQKRKLQSNTLKVGHSSNFLYQGFAKKYFLGIYLHSKA